MTSTIPGTDSLSVTSTDTRKPWIPQQADGANAKDTSAELDLIPVPLLLRSRSGVYTRLRPLPGWPVLPKPFRTGPDPDGQAYEPEVAEQAPNPDEPGSGALGTAGLAEGARAAVPWGPRIPLPPRLRFGTEELRVDVDGRVPTMTVSGVISGGIFARKLTWIARVRRTPTGTYAGNVSYRDGASSLLPQTRVEVALHPVIPLGALSATATFSGGGAPTVSRAYNFARSWFREVNVEFDTVNDATAVTTYDTASHPNRPATLPAETLTLDSAYGRMGIRVTRSAGDSTIDLTDAGANALWSDIEMHDAMQHNWSRWADVPQWAMWVLFARQHEIGSSLGGIMFDDIGAAQRQGCAIFSESFVAQAPPGDPAPAAWVQRMRFWTAVHEMGHAFNLAHSWQKSLGTAWVPLSDEPESGSYMNYPYRVAAAPGKTPEQTFFSNFQFRFSESELLFLRHAPERFVEMGSAPWFDHHAFEQARAETASPLQLTARLHRRTAFEFLEPVVLELKLKNVSEAPLLVDAKILEGHQLSLLVTRAGGVPHLVRPYASKCFTPQEKVVMPGESLYASAAVSYDAYGFAIQEPGEYTVHAMLELDELDVLAAPMKLRVMRPRGVDEEIAAEQLFTDDVRAVLAVGGTRELESVNDVLADVVERLPDSRIAVHANAALGTVAARPGKVLGKQTKNNVIKVKLVKADMAEADSRLGAAFADLNAAADTFGHIDVTTQVVDAANALGSDGNSARAGAMVDELAATLEARGVKDSVVKACRKEAAQLRG